MSSLQKYNFYSYMRAEPEEPHCGLDPQSPDSGSEAGMRDSEAGPSTASTSSATGSGTGQKMRSILCHFSSLRASAAQPWNWET